MSTAAAPGGSGPSHPHGQIPNQPTINFQHEDGDDDEGDDDDEGGGQKKNVDKKSGRRKIKIEFINDKSRRHITFSKRKAGIMKKAYELSTLTGTQVLLLVVSETGLVYTFTTAKLQPLVTQPEGKNLIQACLNAPAGQIPTGAPLGQSGNTVHQANVHPQPTQQSGPVPVTHPASGVAQGLPPPTAMPPPVRNVAGGISIGDKRGDEDDMDDDDDEGSLSEEAASPLNPRAPGLQRHTSHHNAPGQPRGAAGTTHSARGAHHSVHPYAGGSARDAHGGHRRRTSSSANASSSGKVTSPRMGLHRQTSGINDSSGSGSGGGPNMDTQSPTISHYPPGPPGHPGHAGVHDPQAMYGYAPQQQHQAQGGYPPPMGSGPPTGWGQVQPGVHPAHRR